MLKKLTGRLVENVRSGTDMFKYTIQLSSVGESHAGQSGGWPPTGTALGLLYRNQSEASSYPQH